MSYTVLPEGNLVISKDMDRVREVLKGTNVTAVLFGSYGRGEGAFIDGKPRNWLMESVMKMTGAIK